ncbi:trypsin-like serine protease [Streptomyces novaecaesareae]|uniref:trypsin-like serine protease n=1 Tax=Streptomyces novaecaesareae TaxID=68244 RepID=UPI00068C3C7B|nr:trypsin-like serine protease [Streptomyces novaecaesareae]
MSRKNSYRSRRAGVLVTAAAAGAMTTLSGAPAGAVTGDAAADGAYAATVRLVVGDNLRGCTGALVDQYWVIGAASCFADDPAQPQALAAGAPKWKTTAGVGGVSAQVVELVPHQDRDLVMARLATPVSGVAPLAVATTAPTAGQTLRVAGFGRTKDEWVPNRLHTGSFSLDTVSPAGIGITGTGGAAVCKGDTGAPAIRETGGKAELVAVASRSWQGGCLGTPATETRTGAYGTRVDDLGAWIEKVRHSTPSGTVLTGSPFTVADPATGHLVTFLQDSKNHLWSVDPQGEGWSDLGVYAATRPTAIANPADNHVMVYVNGPDNKLWSYDRATGKWTEFIRTPAGTVLAPDAVPRTVVDPATGHLVTFVRDTAHHLWSVDPQGEGWYDFGPLAATDPVPVINPNDGHIVVYVNGPDNKLNSIDRRGAGRVEFVPTASGTVLAGDAVPSTVVDPATGHFTTFVRDTAHHLWSVDPFGPGWRDWGVMAATDPVAVADQAGKRTVVYVNGPNNRLNSLDFSTGKWTEFIPTPAGTALAADAVPQTVVDPVGKHLVTFVRDGNGTLWSVDPQGPGWVRYHGGPSAP